MVRELPNSSTTTAIRSGRHLRPSMTADASPPHRQAYLGINETTKEADLSIRKRRRDGSKDSGRIVSEPETIVTLFLVPALQMLFTVAREGEYQ
jgi:hypothetical protein